jgi:hypothetical protein
MPYRRTLLILSLCWCALPALAQQPQMPALPQAQALQIRFLPQNWSMQQIQWFYHQNQGTIVMPYAWFVALEQPVSQQPFHDVAYMGKFGFLADGAPSSTNPDGLPVGFAKTMIPFPAGPPSEFVGLTCATCHTGQVNYKGVGIRIEGGAALIDLSAFHQDIAFALGATAFDPFKWDRFAHKVLGSNYNPPAVLALKEAFNQYLAQAAFSAGLQALANTLWPGSIPAGIGRLDAIGSGANQVLAFGGVGILTNFLPTNAPVSYPFLWNVPQFDWAQYNGSIEQPMARNAIEAIGVGVPVNLCVPPKQPLFQSNLSVQNLYDLEKALSVLWSPAWPEEILGAIDKAKADRGRVLYNTHCVSCHEVVDRAKPPAAIAVKMVDLPLVGTDPNQAVNLNKRTVDTGCVNAGSNIPVADFLKLFTTKVVNMRYDDLHIPPAQRDIMNGNKPNNWRTLLAYRARPLNGIWATPPYLHDGSVPNLYQVLLPPEQRTKQFYVGNREFDPRNVGFEFGSAPGAFLLDTTISGNSNMGHDYGTKLAEPQRLDLLEFLKTL